MNNKIFLVPLLTLFIILSFLISLVYGIYTIKETNIKKNWCNINCLFIFGCILFILLASFNSYIYTQRNIKSPKLIV